MRGTEDTPEHMPADIVYLNGKKHNYFILGSGWIFQKGKEIPHREWCSKYITIGLLSSIKYSWEEKSSRVKGQTERSWRTVQLKNNILFFFPYRFWISILLLFRNQIVVLFPLFEKDGTPRGYMTLPRSGGYSWLKQCSAVKNSSKSRRRRRRRRKRKRRKTEEEEEERKKK